MFYVIGMVYVIGMHHAGQDCLEPESASEGDYILLEGAPLGSDAKFYLVESGTVHCLKTYEVRLRVFYSTLSNLSSEKRRQTATPVSGSSRLLVATACRLPFLGDVALVTHNVKRKQNACLMSNLALPSGRRQAAGCHHYRRRLLWGGGAGDACAARRRLCGGVRQSAAAVHGTRSLRAPHGCAPLGFRV